MGGRQQAMRTVYEAVYGPQSEQEMHRLKTWPPFFQEIKDGLKKHELRKNDRGYKRGDLLLLREWIPDTNKYTGREVLVQVTYMSEDRKFGVELDWVCMSIQVVDAQYEAQSPKAALEKCRNSLGQAMGSLYEARHVLDPRVRGPQVSLFQMIATAQTALQDAIDCAAKLRGDDDKQRTGEGG